MGRDLKDSTAIVTGVSSGIGRATAIHLASKGVTVVGVARRREQLEDTMARCPNGIPVVADVSDRAAMERLIEGALDRRGGVDILVNNAGIPMRIGAQRLTIEQIERVMHVNYFGAMYATMAVLPSMLARGSGDIVNVSSVGGRVGSPRESAYCASKFAMSGMTEVFASDLAGTGVRMHLVHPGPIRTEIWDLAGSEEPPAFRGKFYEPEDVARAIARVVERNEFERWVPNRLRFTAVARALFPQQFVNGLARYDRKSAKDRARA